MELSGSDIPHAVVMTNCVFEQEPKFEAASTKLIDLSDSQMPGLDMRDVRVDGLLRLVNCRSSATLRLTRLHVSGTADLTRIRLNGNPALLADSLVAERDFLCRDAVIHGEALMWSARVGGTLVLENTCITNPGGVTFNGDGLVVEGGFFGGNTPQGPDRRLRSEGEMRLQDAQISRCCALSGADVSNPGGTALCAERLHVEGPLTLDGAFAAEGTVTLAGATVQGPLRLQGATLHTAGRCALDASLARIGGELDASSGLTVSGQILLEGTHVEGSVNLAHAQLLHPGGETLSARRLHVLGGLYCRGLASEGHIVLTDARVGASVEFYDARLANPASRTLTAWGMNVGGTLNCCEGFTSYGRVSLTSSHIGSALCLAGATIEGALSFKRIQAGSLKTDSRTEFRGPVDARHARVGVLADVPARWPNDLSLDGLVYDHLETPLPLEGRLAWLAKEPTGYLPQPYEQLAATYFRYGHDDEARDVLLAKSRHQHADQSAALRLWGRVQDWTVGYGYRPGRAVGWLLLLLLIATVAFTAHHPPAVKPAEAPPFNPLLYGLDLLLPIVGFGQQEAYRPGGWQQWLAAALIAAGYVLATTIAAGLTRTLARR
ncbi:oxidoreductase [Streptomyces sp. NPDC085900]|uniref:oxidoreductase n=1 Tax=Streptomyces sp. NPDC085900 TaxID=3365737 RepID=UPI0037D42960